MRTNPEVQGPAVCDADLSSSAHIDVGVGVVFSARRKRTTNQTIDFEPSILGSSHGHLQLDWVALYGRCRLHLVTEVGGSFASLGYRGQSSQGFSGLSVGSATLDI